MDLHRAQMKRKGKEWSNIFLEEFDTSSLDSLLWIEGSFLVSVTQPELFPFKLLVADDRGERKGRGELSAATVDVPVLGVLLRYPQTLLELLERYVWLLLCKYVLIQITLLLFDSA